MANLANLKNVNFLKMSDRVRHGLDYLRLNFTTPISFFEEKMRTLVSNSDSYFEDGRTYSKIPLSSGMCIMVSYSYNGVALPIMLYNVFGNNQLYRKYARLDFYGSFFRLIECGEFPKDYFLTYVKELTDEEPTISRVDYCFDLFSLTKIKKLPTQKKILKKINDSSRAYEIKKGTTIESWSVGSKTNKRYIVRCYDKLLDTQKKGKFFLYGDYLQYKSVHRFEVEFGPKFTRGFYLSRIDDLCTKILYFLGIKDNFFDGALFYEYTDKCDINEYNKTMFFKQFLGKSRKIALAGYNPYLVIFNGLSVDLVSEYDKQTHINYIKELIASVKSIDDFKNKL